MNACASCKWWVQSESYQQRYGATGQRVRMGECRVRPPVVMMVPYNREDRGVSYQMTGEFPEVPEDAFCKEHDAG